MEQTLYNLVAADIENHCNNCAIIWASGSGVIKATYREVFIESEIVSKCLQEVGVEGGFVGIFMTQNLTLPALILGILRRNLAFTCLDPSISCERNINFLDSLNVAWVFTEKEGGTCVLSEHGEVKKIVHVHNNTILLWHVTRFKSNDITTSKYKNNMAYAIQTSGTTGLPKIVRVPHKCIVPNIQHLSILLDIEPIDVVYLGAPSTFDPSIIELFLALVNGAALLIVPLTIKASSTLLLDTLFPCNASIHTGVTVLQITPSLISRWSQHDLQRVVFGPQTALRILLLGGEPCPSRAKLRNWRGPGNKTQMFNIYGITEVSCWASVYHIDEKSESDVDIDKTLIVRPVFCDDVTMEAYHDIPLGTVLLNTLLEVRDELGGKILHGEGELYVGSMDRICIINEEIEELLSPPVFRATGDIVKVDTLNGNMFYVGRKYNLIKRYGHRVSLTEIEKTVTNFSNVKHCCCHWNETKLSLGLVVTLQESDASLGCSETLQQKLVKHLPKECLPDAVAIVDALPLTEHGKVDRDKLDIILSKSKEETLNIFLSNASTNSVLTTLWSQFLGVFPRPEDTFLQCGGHSVLAMQLFTEIEKVLGRIVPNSFIAKLLTGSTFRECCLCLNNPIFISDCDKLNIQTEASGSSEGISDAGHKFSNTDKSYQEVKDSSSKRKCLSSEYRKWYKRKGNVDTEGINRYCTNYSLDYRHDFHNISNKQEHCIKDVEQHETQITMENEGKNEHNNVLEPRKNAQSFEVMKLLSLDGKGNSEEGLQSTGCRGQSIVYAPTKELMKPCKPDKISLQYDWKFDLGKCIDASPCYLKYLSGKSWVIVGSHSQRFVVLNALTGSLVVECKLPDRIESSVCPSPCGKYGIIGCYDGKVYCIELISGRVIWSFSTGGMVKSSPALCLQGTGIVVGSYDSNLYCINIQDGNLIWHMMPGKGSIFASPCVSNNSIVYIATLDGTCAAVCEYTGKLKWHRKLESPVFSSPTLVRDSMAVLFAEVTGTVHCFSSDSGNALWTYKAGGNIFSSICTRTVLVGEPAEVIIFGCHNKTIYFLKWLHQEDNCRLQWLLEVDSAVFATPFMFCTKRAGKDKYFINDLIVDLEDSNITLCAAIATTKGTAVVIDAKSSEILCSYCLPHEVFSSPVVCSGKLIVGCRDNCLYSLNIVS